MLSFISNSEALRQRIDESLQAAPPAPLVRPRAASSAAARIPRTRLGVAWGVALLFSGLAIGSYEIFARSRGFKPMPTDDGNLWCLARSQVHSNDPRQIVLIGTSRMHHDVIPDLLSQALNRDVVQLAISGESPLPVLEDLSRDESFCGVVISDVLSQWFFSHMQDDGVAESYVAQYHHLTPADRTEARADLAVQEMLAVRSPLTTLHDLLNDLGQGKMPRPSCMTIRPDRTATLDFSKRDAASLQLMVAESDRGMPAASSPEQLREDMAKLNEMVDRIQRRGGRVIFVFLPFGKQFRPIEEKHWPRAEYWDVMAAGTAAITVHFDDYPMLAQFDAPDGSHLDMRDAAQCTHILAEILQDRLKPAVPEVQFTQARAE